MPLMVIFSLIVVFAAFGAIRSIRDKNLLGIFFSVGTVVVFALFTVMTIVDNGFPTGH